MVCLGLEPGAAGWKALTNPLSYGGTPIVHYLATYYQKKNCPIARKVPKCFQIKNEPSKVFKILQFLILW